MIRAGGEATEDQMALKNNIPRGVKINLGDLRDKEALKLFAGQRYLEARTRAHVTLMIAGALVVLYALYIAHEWWAGASFESIGQFLENSIWLFLGWCIGREFPCGRVP
jgi:hypothetical protein